MRYEAVRHRNFHFSGDATSTPRIDEYGAANDSKANISSKIHCTIGRFSPSKNGGGRVIRTSLVPFVALLLFGQTKDDVVKFDAASVRVSLAAVGPGGMHWRSRADGYDVTNETLKGYLQWAYGLESYQIAGPAWLDSATYDISAKAADAVPGAQMKRMTQTLLTDRFQIASHREQRELPVYLLSTAKSGPPIEKAEPGNLSYTMQPEGQVWCCITTSSYLARRLTNELGRPVLDRTGLQGYIAIRFTCPATPDRLSGFDASTPGGCLSRALPKLGLQLESRKSPVEVLVIDHAEKTPTAN